MSRYKVVSEQEAAVKHAREQERSDWKSREQAVHKEVKDAERGEAASEQKC